MTAERQQKIQDYQATDSSFTDFTRFEGASAERAIQAADYITLHAQAIDVTMRGTYNQTSSIEVENVMTVSAAKRHSIIEDDDETA